MESKCRLLLNFTHEVLLPFLIQNVSVMFLNNSAGLSGAAIYASSMHQCAWLGSNYSSDAKNIFLLPNEIAEQSPFWFKYAW